MSEGEQLGLLANLPKLRAQTAIADGKYDRSDIKGIGNLWLTAYGDEEVARQAERKAAEAFVREACEAARMRNQSN